MERDGLIRSGVRADRWRRAHLIIRQHARLIRRLCRRGSGPDRPTRTAAWNVGGRSQIAAIAERCALAQDRNLERKIRTAYAGTADRPDAGDARALFHGAGTEALHLGIVAPRLALGKKHAAAATRQHAEDAKDNGADEIPTHSPRHRGRMRWFLLTFLQRLARPSGRSCAPGAMVKE